jgi:hypothetical protein
VQYPLAPMSCSPRALQQSYHAVMLHPTVDSVVYNNSIDGSRSDSRMVGKQCRVIENHVARVKATRTVGELAYG